MPGPFKPNAFEVRELGEFLLSLSALTNKHNVRIDANQAATVAIGEDQHQIMVRWDDVQQSYIVDDYTGYP